MSFIYSKHNKGPIVCDPWGTPQGLSWSTELIRLKETYCCLFEKEWIILWAEPHMPHWSNLAKRVLWQTVSNAFSKSKKNIPVNLLLWILSNDVVMMSKIAWAVEMPFWNPYCWETMVLFLSKKLDNRLWINFSIIFEKQIRIEIGL